MPLSRSAFTVLESLSAPVRTTAIWFATTCPPAMDLSYEAYRVDLTRHNTRSGLDCWQQALRSASAREPNKQPKRADLTAPQTRHPQAATRAAILWKVELATS